MPYANCPSCCQTSYSASDQGDWKCPYCGRLIPKPIKPFEEVKEIHICAEIVPNASAPKPTK